MRVLRVVGYPARCANQGLDAVNLSSALLHADPDQAGALRQRLCQIPGVALHADSADGRMILTLEAPDLQSAADLYQTIERLPGVWSMALVYQHSESNPDQEVLPCN